MIKQLNMAENKNWSSGKILVFYFLFSYSFLYAFPQVLDGLIPPLDFVLEKYYQAQENLLSFIGDAVFKLGYYEPNYNSGSGDQPFFYVKLLVLIVVSVIVALTWFSIKRSSKIAERLYNFLRVYLRYFLAVILLSYGIGKIFPSQMPELTPIQLTQPYGQFSPMGIAWAFMGTSAPFQIFTGVLEVVAALFLFFRRTTTLGALLAVIVLGGVVAFNFCYDIPVKINSTHYFLTAVFLLLHDRKKLLAVFFNQSVNIEKEEPLFALKSKYFKAGRVIKYLYILYVLYLFTNDTANFYYKEVKQRRKHPLFGVYDVNLFIRNNDTIPLLKGDRTVWNKVVMSYPNVLTVRDMNDSLHRFPVSKFDSIKHIISISTMPGDSSVLSYSKAPDGSLTLSGLLNGDTVLLKASYIPRDSFLVVNRGFHWISERPYNR